MENPLPSSVTPEHKERFERDGFFILESVVPPEHLELMRAQVAEKVARVDAEMEAKGVDRMGIQIKGSRYFFGAYDAAYQEGGDDSLGAFIFSDLMAEITRATLGDNVYLFFEQYVIKAAEKGGDFSWHQDSGYVGHPDHKPYLTCWVTLDAVNEENGTVYMLPYDRAGTRDYVAHVHNEASSDLVGYHGNDPGIPVICPAGSIAVFSSTVFHRSGANTTDKMRRVYLPQYSVEPILRSDGKLFSLAVPFIVDGQRVR